MGNFNRIILGFVLGLIPFILKAQSDPDWPRFELYQLVQGQDSGIFVITDSDSNLIFTDLLKMRFFSDTALIFNGDTIAVKPDIPTLVEGLGISIEYDQVLNQYYIESLSIEDTIHNGTASIINKGTPLYAAGIQGNYWSVAPADASDANKMPVVIIAGEDINPGEDGLGLIKGHIKQVNTTGLASGSEVYVAAGGGYTSTKPKGENNIIQRLGTVIKGNTNNGSGIINLGDPQASGNLNPDKIFIGASDSTVTTINLKQLISDSISTKGTVSSVAATASNGISVTGSPITTTGTLAITSNATTLNNANTIVLRDGSGNFKAGVIEANLAGIAREVQSALTPGYGLAPSDTYNGSIARTYRVDTTKLATLAAVADTAFAIRSSIGTYVTGTFINGAVPYSASGGSTLTNSGWSIDGGKLLRGYSVASYDLDVNGSIGGTTLTATGRINADSILVTKGATFNTQQGAFNFRVDGDLETGLIFANASTNRVGIGLTGNPNYKLDVNGDVNIAAGSKYRIGGVELSTVGTTINNNAAQRLITGSNTANTLNAQDSLTWNGQTLWIQHFNTPILRIGDLSINHFSGVSDFENLVSGYFRFRNNSAQTIIKLNQDRTVEIPALGGSGSIDIGVDNNGVLEEYTSDTTLKEILSTNIKGIEVIKDIETIKYKWRDKQSKGKQTEIGFNAQNIKKVLPEASYTIKSNGKLGVKKDAIIATLVKAVQEQQIQIEELKQELKRIKKNKKIN